MHSKAQFSPYFTASYWGDKVEGRLWLPAVVRIVARGKISEVEAFAFGSG